MASDGTVAKPTPGRLAFGRMVERYPVLGDIQNHGELVAQLAGYMASLLGAVREPLEGVAPLVRLAEATGDPGAPATLLHEYMAALDECGIPVAQSRASIVLALADLAEVTRRESGMAAASAEARAQLDPVSGLPTATAMQRALAGLIDETRESRLVLALLCLNLHHTTPLLDQPGYPTQEELLHAVVTRLRSALRPNDLLARTESLEFMVALPGLRSAGQAMLAAHKLSNVLAAPLVLADLKVQLSRAIGIASYPDNAEAPAGLMQCARLTAEEARSNSQEYAAYSGKDKAEDAVFADLERDLREAMQQNDLELYFQPQLELANGQVHSVEALLRWQRRPGEWVNPGDIIRTANRPGLVGQLSNWIISAAVRQVANWAQQDLHITVGVNLWAKALLEHDLPDLIKLTLDTWDVPPERLLIEITEGEMIKDWARSREVIGNLKRVGVTIAMDDFGTGYSHYSWLRDLDVDEIKIDQLFVRDLLRGPKDEPIVRSVIGLGHELGLVVVAEGVEDQPTQDALQRMGCDRIQGYWLSRPLEAEACTRFLLEHSGR